MMSFGTPFQACSLNIKDPDLIEKWKKERNVAVTNQHIILSKRSGGQLVRLLNPALGSEAPPKFGARSEIIAGRSAVTASLVQ